MKKENAKEKLHEVILDLESERSETEKRIQNREDEILQAKRYLQSLYEKEDADIKIFSPRNIESRYKEDIAKSKERIRTLEKENQTLYHEQNVIKKRIDMLREISQDFEKRTELFSNRQASDHKNDTDVNEETAQKTYDPKHDRNQSVSAKPENTNQIMYTDDETDMLHIVQALDNDRKRIASDLHDTVVQDLVHAIHKVELCARYMDQDSVQAKLELVSIEKYLRETIQRARNFIGDLRPIIFDDFGFRGTLMNAIEELQKNTSMMISAEVDELLDVNNDKCIVLYRVAMELLRNAVFHSGGSKVCLTVKKEHDIVQLAVVDDGSGFHMDNNTDKHFGLELVKERTYLIGGTFHIDSTEQGTCVKIILRE